MDNDPNIEARRQNVEFPCPCADTDFCLHSGTCVSAPVPYCICPPGWTGARCGDIVTDPRPGLSLSLNPKVTNISFLPTIFIHNQVERLQELTK